MKLFGVVRSLAGVVVVVLVAVDTLAAEVASSGSPDLTVSDPKNAFAGLNKTVFSSKLRMVLAVGVEGTGHEYVLQVDDHLFENTGDLVRLTADDTVNVGIYHLLHSMGRNVKHYSDVIGWGRAEMRKLKEREEELASPGTVMLIHGKYSYPDGWGLNKVMKYLDLRLLAEAAEAEGVDFRILYLQRPAKDILVANTIHRNFQDALGDTGETDPEQRYMEYMQILITDIAVMHSFLAEVDPAFVVCHDFERAGEPEQSSAIANFLAPNADVAEPLKQSLMDVARAHGPSTEGLLYEGADAVASRMQHKFDAFESTLCAGRN